MSIARIQELVQNKGCQVILGIIAVLSLIGLTFTSGQCAMFGGPGDPNALPEEARVFAKVGDANATYSELEALIQVFAAENPAMRSTDGYTNSLATNIQSLVRAKAAQALAEQAGVDVSDEKVQELFTEQADQQIEQAQQQLVDAGMLKADADQAAIDAAFQANYQQSVAAIREMLVGQMQTNYDNLKGVDGLGNPFAEVLLLNHMAETMELSEEEIDEQFTVYNVKTMPFDKQDVPMEERQQSAEEAHTSLINGGEFENVRAKFAPESPKEANPYTLQIINQLPLLEPIKSLEDGEVTDVIDTPSGPVIFQLVNKEVKRPEDWEANKEEYSKSLQQQRAGEKLDEDLKAYIESDKVVWLSDTYRLLFEYAQTIGNPEYMTDAKKRQDYMRDLLSQADTIDPAGLGSDKLPYLRYAAQSAIYGLATDAEKTELRTERIEVLREILTVREDAQIRIQLAQLFLEEGNSEEAVLQLTEAVEVTTDYGTEGQSVISSVQGIVFDAEQKNSMSPEILKTVQDALVGWSEDRAAWEADQAAMEAERQKLEDELRQEQEKVNQEKAELGEGGEESTESEAPATTGGGESGNP